MKCSFRCTYCISDSQGESQPTVEPHQLLNSLEQDFQQAAQHGHDLSSVKIIISCHTDAYTYIEEKLKLTRQIIQFFGDKRQRFSLVTRNDLVLRDLDIIRGAGDLGEVSFSLPVLDESFLKKHEPHVPSPTARLKAIHAIHQAGIRTTVRIDPWIPGITDVEKIFQQLPQEVDVLIAPLYLNEVSRQIFTGDDRIVEVDTNHKLAKKVSTFRKNGLSVTASKLFSEWTQSDIDRAYIKERNRIGFRKKTRWFYPETFKSSGFGDYMKFLKPNEIVL